MLNQKRIIAVIPARGGSKGIVKKNIAKVGDLPLVAWSILACKQSGLVDCIHVSTDDEEIAEVSRKYGADVPYLRPESLSTDVSSTYDAISFTLDKYEEVNQTFDVVIELQPTYPFRINGLINACLQSFLANPENKSLISVIKTENTAHSDYCVNMNNGVIQFKKLPSDFRRQNLNPEFSFHGIFICTYVDELRKNRNMCHSHHTVGYEISDPIVNIDINTPFDLFLANQIILHYNLKGI